jgi:hypothetical protein
MVPKWFRILLFEKNIGRAHFGDKVGGIEALGLGVRRVAAPLVVEIAVAIAAEDGGSPEPSFASKLFIEAHA